MSDSSISIDQGSSDPRWEAIPVPEEPFGICQTYWKAGLILFSFLLMYATVIILMKGGSAHVIGALYVIPAILLSYFYRRRGVLLVYLLAMFFFCAVVVFQYPSASDIFAAALRSLLLIAIALTVSYLTHYLLMEKRKYHAIFENTENGVILLNIPDCRVLEMNERFVRALGIKDNELRGRDLAEFITDPGPLIHLVTDLKAHCNTPALEFAMRRSDGSGWAAVIAARKISANHAVLTFIDITERRKIDEQLRICHADAELYVDILTHDINNINTASLNYGRLLEANSGEKRQELSHKLMRSLEKSDEIIRNVSTLRKMRSSASLNAPVHLGEIIRREISVFPDAAIDYDGSDAVVMADDMLASVFNNLIGNSIKYGGENPAITIQVEDRGSDVLVSIGDRGKGIPDLVKLYLFERFRRGDTTVSGKGLGLFICKTLIERYGGRIWVEDQVPGDPTQGAIMRFTLNKP
jgi:PAS domain S-box-containing protein